MVRGAAHAAPRLPGPSWPVAGRTAAFGPARGELAAHRESLSTGRACTPARGPAPPSRRSHAAVVPELRRSPAPTTGPGWAEESCEGHGSPANGQWTVARRRSKTTHGKDPLKVRGERRDLSTGPLGQIWVRGVSCRRVCVTRFALELTATVRLRSAVVARPLPRSDGRPRAARPGPARSRGPTPVGRLVGEPSRL